MTPPNPALDPFFAKSSTWNDELARLRAILLACNLGEALKWGKPTYTYQGANIVLIMPLKATCALLFPKGALLEDPHALLVQPGENSQSARQLRFTSTAQISQLETPLKSLVEQAIAVEKAGLKVAFRKSSDLVYPAQFQERLDNDAALRQAFQALTPGRQRQYHLHFTGAKQAATLASRVEKAIVLILAGSGLNER